MLKRLSNLFKSKQIEVDPEKDVILFKVNCMLKSDVLNALYFDLQKQYETGVIVVPEFIDVMIIPKGTEILVEQESEINDKT